MELEKDVNSLNTLSIRQGKTMRPRLNEMETHERRSNLIIFFAYQRKKGTVVLKNFLLL